MKYLWLIFTIPLAACAQEPAAQAVKSGYTIDKNIPSGAGKRIEPGRAIADISWLENGKEATPGLLSGKNMPCMTYSTWLNDTTCRIIISHFIMPSGIAIDIIRDSASVYHFVSSKDKSLRSFKSSPRDSVYTYSPEAPARSFKLVLSRRPSSNDPVEGYVEFESAEFYQRDAPADMKRKYMLKGYFRTEPF